MIVVRDWRTTEAALRAAREDGTSPTLVTPEDAASFYGAGYLAALQERARQEFPDVAFTLVVDCGDAPGHALACLRAGVKTDLDGPDERQDRRHRPADGRRTGKETDMSWQPTRLPRLRRDGARSQMAERRAPRRQLRDELRGRLRALGAGRRGLHRDRPHRIDHQPGRHERPRPRRRGHVRVRQPGRLLAPDARLPGARPADDRVRLRAGARAQSRRRRRRSRRRASTSAATAGAGSSTSC